MKAKFAYYTLSASPVAPGGMYKRCGSCKALNGLGRRACGRCARRFRRRPKKARPRRGTEDRLRQDLAHAASMADRWTSRVKAAVTLMHQWARKERQLAARLAAGPQAPRPKRAKPVRRGIVLPGRQEAHSHQAEAEALRP